MERKQLVKLCQAGDRKALGVLYESYLRPMRKVVARYVDDPAAVWDILHDGFIIAFSSIGSLRQESRLEPWLTSIMRNLALQYLRSLSATPTIPLSEVADVPAEEYVKPEFTWEELEKIVERLPDGYGKVFRLAVLDGLSHKEIGAMLGIAPHSSSSQLVHAKAMLRRLIRQYRVEAGLLSLVAVALTLWYLWPEGEGQRPSAPVLSRNEGVRHDVGSVKPSVTPSQTVDSIYNPERKPLPAAVGAHTDVSVHEQIAEAEKPVVPTIEQSVDSIPTASADTVPHETERQIPQRIYPDDTHFAVVPDYGTSVRRPNASTGGWSLSLAYSGAVPQKGPGESFDEAVADPGDPPYPPGEIDLYADETDYKMPVVVGLYVNKSLTGRWSLETGVRYTYLESEWHYYDEIPEKRMKQQIHYIGIPLKINYRIFTAGGFSLYGQGGGAVDIPFRGRSATRRMYPYGELIIDKGRINAPEQWSVGAGIGIQYHFSPTLSIFAEPSVNYYFNPGGNVRTIRQNKPWEFSLPLGLRFTW